MKALAPDDPRVIGEFRLRARLGAGGMGRVYLGLSPAGRAVAIKVVNPDLASDDEFLHRFAQEVAAARAVSGIYTAPVVASGLNERPPWLATAFVPGPPLDQVVAENGPLPEQALWPLLAGLVEALQAIHACGVVHRDLKPANVLLATDGPRVIDFGIARAADGTSLTAAGVVFGTPGYMSPEQAEGAQAGPPSDVFSLGCVLAYAATGSAPFGGGSAASVLYRVVTGQPDLTRVPPRLRDVIAACMTKSPAQRPGLAALGAMISQAGPAVSATLTSFWPAPLDALIRAGQAYPTQAPPAAGPAAGVAAGAGLGPPSGLAPSGFSPTGLAGPGQAGARQSGMVQDGYHAMATASMTARQPPGGAPTFGSGLPGSGPPGSGPPGSGPPGSGPPGSPTPPSAAYQPASWPQGTPQTPWPQSSPADAMAQYTPAPARPWRPTSVVTAAWLMYAGAAASLLGMLIDVSVIGQIKTDYLNHHPLVNPASVNATAAGGVVVTIVGSLICIGLWLWLAAACKRGHGWARIVGTVLFGINTLGYIVTLARPGIPAIKSVHLLIWLIGLVTVIQLFRRQSGEFFAATRRR
jgi:eukaryotic-like serine/threonine-protein kinase